MRGFNVGVTISLGDMELALDYLNDESKFMPDIELYKNKGVVDAVTDTVYGIDKENSASNINNIKEYQEQDIDDTGDDYFDDSDEDDYYSDEDDEYLDINSDEADTEEEYNEVNNSNNTTVNVEDTRVRSTEGVSNRDYIQKKLRVVRVNKIEERNNRAIHKDVESNECKNHKENKEVHLEEKLIEVESKPRGIDNKYRQNVNNKRNTEIAEDDIPKINYGDMDIDALYAEVKKYMQEMGVGKRPIIRKQLENEFGVKNVKKLLMKSYLISLGNTITIGR